VRPKEETGGEKVKIKKKIKEEMRMYVRDK